MCPISNLPSGCVVTAWNHPLMPVLWSTLILNILGIVQNPSCFYLNRADICESAFQSFQRDRDIYDWVCMGHKLHSDLNKFKKITEIYKCNLAIISLLRTRMFLSILKWGTDYLPSHKRKNNIHSKQTMQGKLILLCKLGFGL